MRLTQFDRVPKAEIYSKQIRKGSITWERSKRSTAKNSKKKQYDWRTHPGSRLHRLPANWGISDSAIHGWRRELAQHGKEAFPGKGHQTELEEENRRLKRELERVQQERDILKKVVGIFSRESK